MIAKVSFMLARRAGAQSLSILVGRSRTIISIGVMILLGALIYTNKPYVTSRSRWLTNSSPKADRLRALSKAGAQIVPIVDEYVALSNSDPSDIQKQLSKLSDHINSISTRINEQNSQFQTKFDTVQQQLESNVDLFASLKSSVDDQIFKGRNTEADINKRLGGAEASISRLHRSVDSDQLNMKISTLAASYENLKRTALPHSSEGLLVNVDGKELLSDKMISAFEQHFEALQIKELLSLRQDLVDFNNQKNKFVNIEGVAFEVSRALEKYHADYTGKPDYALYSAGGRVDASKTSPTFSRSNIALAAMHILRNFAGQHPASTAITPGNMPGQCWPMEGTIFFTQEILAQSQSSLADRLFLRN